MKRLMLIVALCIPLLAQTTNTVTVCPPGSTSANAAGCKSAQIATVVPTYISAFACLPTTLAPGQTATCTATLNQAVPSIPDYAKLGWVGPIFVAQPSLNAPASLTIPIGSISGTFTVTNPITTASSVDLSVLAFTALPPTQKPQPHMVIE
jgi:hypothetical protein